MTGTNPSSTTTESTGGGNGAQNGPTGGANTGNAMESTGVLEGIGNDVRNGADDVLNGAEDMINGGTRATQESR